MIRPIDLREKLGAFEEFWSPRIIGSVNGQDVKLAKLRGAFVWHGHEASDELFLVLHGRLRIELRDGAVELEEGQACIVPRGVEHRPVAEGEAHVLLFEAAGTRNTGGVTEARTVERPENI